MKVSALRYLWEGRTPHKGFTRFLDWAEHCRHARANWVFVQAGHKPNIGRSTAAIRSVGYVEDNAAAYLASDLVVIPNKHAYFDIGALETLSLGARVAMSAVGGHIHLLKTCPSIPVIPDQDAASVWACLEKVAAEYARTEIRQQQMQAAWQQRYCPATFAQHHVELALSLQ